MANSKLTQHTVNEDDKRFFTQQEQEEIAKHHNVETPNIEHPENEEQYTGPQAQRCSTSAIAYSTTDIPCTTVSRSSSTSMESDAS